MTETKRIIILTIKEIVEERYGVSVCERKGSESRNDVAEARGVLTSVTRMLFGLTYCDISKTLNINKSTLLVAAERVNERSKTDKILRKEINTITEIAKAKTSVVLTS
jgi:chromosomal replication initiation ATPase DnaA